MAGVQCRKGKTMKRFYKRKFWFMVLPSIVLFLLVIIVPFIEGVIYSFTEWRGSYFVVEGFPSVTWIHGHICCTRSNSTECCQSSSGTHDQEAYQGQGTFQNGTVPSICTWNARHGLCMAFHI